MRAKKIAISEELYDKLVLAFSSSIGIRQSVVEKSLESFLTDLLEYLANEPETLRELLSTGPRKESRGSASQTASRPGQSLLSTGNSGS